MNHLKLRFGSILLLLTMLVLAGCSTSGGTPEPPTLKIRASAPFILSGVADVKNVAKLIGADSINKTDRYKVAGADLGSMINVGDKTYFALGDTFGYREPGMTGGGGDDWRSNVMAVSSDNNPADGITFDSFIADSDNHANELIVGLKDDDVEVTKIPTYGVAVGTTMYLYFMSVKEWDPAPGVWSLNYSSVSKSTDGGVTWNIVDSLRWEPDSNFGQVSTFKVKNAEGMVDIYFWGIPGGRFDGVKLMKVPETQIEDLSAYRYFTGANADGSPNWSESVKDATQIVTDTVGELSVIWNPYLDRWIMTYLRGAGEIVIREGINPWGPWNKPITLVSQSGFPNLYGPFMNPKYVENDGETIYFTLSDWQPYSVFWMKARLLKGQ